MCPGDKLIIDNYDNGPVGSSDIYRMGLRSGRCNGCKLAQLKHELGEKFLIVDGAVYELGAEPLPGQGTPQSHEGRPIQFRAWFMSTGHSDECYHWKPPEEKG